MGETFPRGTRQYHSMVESDENDWWPDEAAYCRYLNTERQLYALALVNYGKLTPEQADREALERYPYEPPNTPYRGIIFHDFAWHWAMIRLHGHHYWVSQPQLVQMPDAFRREYERLHD